MNQKKKRSLTTMLSGMLVLVLCITGTAALGSHPPSAPETVANIQELESYFDELVSYGDPPSLVLAVVKDGQPVYNRAFGMADGPKQVRATPDTIYHWYSTTKLFTAVAIFQLQEKGLLNIDDLVITYLPFFDVSYPSATSPQITIRHLLNHSSGIPDNVPAVVGWMHLEHEPALDQTAFLAKVLPDYSKLNFEPGTKSVYTNVGYMVLGSIIEKVSGETYEDYIRENILRPLKMDRTDFVYTTAMPEAAAGMHPLVSLQSTFLPFTYGPRLPGFIREVRTGRMWFNRFHADSNPPTGLIGPAIDLSRFAAAYLNAGELDGQRILSPASTEQMMSEGHLPSSGPQVDWTDQGLGWEICAQDGTPCLEGGGGGAGFGSAIRLLPDRQLGLVLVANSTNIDRQAILDLAASLDW
jgi:CubicO group peptidase (beta-lactamase class C family)